MTTATTDYLADMRACAEAINLNPSTYLTPEDRWVELNGVNFHYLDWGNDHLPHLVLLHGGSLTAHTWDMSALLLRDRYHVIALDQRGHGDTGWTPDDQLDRDNGDLMLEDTNAFIEHLGYDHITLCGMSMGGMNAIRYAARHPQRLDALVVVDIAPVTMAVGLVEMEQFRQDTETMSKFEDFLERAVHFNPQRKPAHLKYSLLHSLKQVDDGWTWKQDHRRRVVPEDMTKDQQSEARELRSSALAADVAAIKTPTLLLRGAISKILSEEAANAMTESMTDCTHVVIEGAGHSVQGDQPAAMAAAITAYLDARAST
ncbi:MAG: alpha/beta hydrolase [Chloroflexi bacterium]|nr:alpha/beta hydrolase [Chloroflexota bacterium]MDA1147676.1 alpha/beta hydrolase [Chloroflexota bacterium]